MALEKIQIVKCWVYKNIFLLKGYHLSPDLYALKKVEIVCNYALKNLNI